MLDMLDVLMNWVIISISQSIDKCSRYEYRYVYIYIYILAPFGPDFFSCRSSPKIKNAKSGKNHSSMDVARLGLRKTNVGARKAGLVT